MAPRRKVKGGRRGVSLFGIINLCTQLLKLVENSTGCNTAKVTAQVVKHLRGPKILVFKKRPKKGYERTIGHRQDLTQIKITDIQLA